MMDKPMSKFKILVAEAKKHVPQTNVEAVHKMIAAGESLHLIDVREQEPWEAGHLPGAIHLSKGIIELNIADVIPDEEAKIVLYCGGGSNSTLAAENVIKMGYKNVLSMDGGFKGWKAAGFEIKNSTL